MPAHERQLWAAACAGDARTVGRLLGRHRLPANMLHPDTGSTLLLDVAAVQALTEQDDKRLAVVMAVLLRRGASLQQRLYPQNDTAVHMLAAQPRAMRVHHRLMLLLGALHRDPRPVSVLMMHNSQGWLPEQAAANAQRHDLYSMLRNHRSLIQGEAVQQAVQDRGRRRHSGSA